MAGSCDSKGMLDFGLPAGVLYVRHCKESTRFVKEWDSMLAESLDRVDQIAFNTLVAKYTTPLRAHLRNDRLATGPQRQLTVGVLPVPHFMNGHTYFIQGLHKVYLHDELKMFHEYDLSGLQEDLRECFRSSQI